MISHKSSLNVPRKVCLPSPVRWISGCRHPFKCQAVSKSAQAFTFWLHRGSGSTKSEWLGLSSFCFFPKRKHLPACAHSLLVPQKYLKAFQSLLWLPIPPGLSLIFLARLLFSPTWITVLDSWLLLFSVTPWGQGLSHIAELWVSSSSNNSLELKLL